ncbi:MAG: hypothetical protein AAF563_22045 [Pseudomonadota bacterium]
MQKIQIGQVAIAGFKALFGQFGAAVRIGWLPLVLVAGSQTVAILLIGNAAIEAAHETGVFDIKDQGQKFAMMKSIGIDLLIDYAWLGVVVFIVTVAAYVMLTSNWLRHLLRGDEPAGRIATVGFGAREIKTLFAGLVLVVLMIGFGLAGAAFAWFSNNQFVFVPMFLLLFVLNIIVYFIVLRLSLVLPMVALDQGIGWGTAWRMSRGNIWRLFWAFFLASLLVNVVFMVVQIPFAMIGGAVSLTSPEGILSGVAIQMAGYAVTYVIGFIVVLGSLAEAYRQLDGPGSMVREDTLAVFDG